MKMTSCKGCGAVLDLENLSFPNNEDYYKDDGSVNTGVMTWDGHNFIPFANCPVCNTIILKTNSHIILHIND